MAGEREAAILGLRHIVLHQARRFAAGPDLRDDLIGEGWLGAIEAVDRYDPTSGATLATFATYRIRGAMVDYMRSRPWLAVAIGRPRVALADDDPRLRAPLDVDELHDQQSTDDTAALAAAHVDAVRLLRQLPPRHREVLWAAEAMDRPHAEMAERLGVTDTRICQMRREALRALAS